jgi:1-deoxy-D-xylulose-5-phosphate reductoisomerase
LVIDGYMKNSITLLGSTGSIGVSTLKVVDFLSSSVSIYGLACRQNLSLLADQIEKYHPSSVAIETINNNNIDDFKKLQKKYPEINFYTGMDGVQTLAKEPVDILVSAIAGAAGLKPTLAAFESTKRIAIANKETLVMAGPIVMEKAEHHNVELIPVDSEHSAIFALLENKKRDEINRIILTASGGSLRDYPLEAFASVRPEQALAHPTWNMGSKITIDSATLFNKGLEVIEAHHLFGVPFENIEVIIHPESIIHSLVETIDGALFAHMGVTDMVHPILMALTYPDKISNPFGILNLAEVKSLHFNSVDNKRYPALDLCYEAGKTKGTMPTVMNAANEVAVEAFLNKKIYFTHIVKVVEDVMNEHNVVKNCNLEDIFNADTEARKRASIIIEG